jgi:hypothetical protein
MELVGNVHLNMANSDNANSCHESTDDAVDEPGTTTEEGADAIGSQKSQSIEATRACDSSSHDGNEPSTIALAPASRKLDDPLENVEQERCRASTVA